MQASRRVFLTSAAVGAVPATAVRATAATMPLDSERFRAAAATGDVSTMASLLDKDRALMWSRDEQGISVFLNACLNRQKAVTDLLRARGLVLDLSEAAGAGDGERIKEILKGAPDTVNLPGPDGRRAIHFAAACGRSEALIMLSSRGAELSAGPESPLLAAADCPEPEAAWAMANFLIGNASDPRAKRKDGTSVLRLAAARGYGDIVGLLIHRGAEWDSEDARAAKGDAAKVLREAGSIERAHYGQRYVRDRQGKAWKEEATGLPQLYINEFVSLSHADPEKVKKMHKACPGLAQTRATWDEMGIEAAAHMSLIPLADYLADAGSPVSTTTAIMLGMDAVAKSNLETDPKAIHERGAHDLPILAYTAFGGGRAEMAGYLIGRGADVHTRAFGQTILHLAATRGQLDLARVLLDHGADVNATAKVKDTPTTPLGMAAANKREEMIKLLASRGGK